MGWIIAAAWAGLAWTLVKDNMELLEGLSVWRAAVATVILTICAPVFFLSDLLECILDWIAEDS